MSGGGKRRRHKTNENERIQQQEVYISSTDDDQRSIKPRKLSAATVAVANHDVVTDDTVSPKDVKTEQAVVEGEGASGRTTAADGNAAVVEAGGVYPEKRRPFWSGL